MPAEPSSTPPTSTATASASARWRPGWRATATRWSWPRRSACPSAIPAGRAAPPPGSRMAGAGDDLEEAPARRAVERNFRAVDAAREVAAELGASVSQVAVAWLLHQPGVTAPIVGPRTPEQLDDLLGAADVA